MTFDPAAPIPLNGATLAAFTVAQPGDNYSRVTVCRDASSIVAPYVVRVDSCEHSRHVEALDAMAMGLALSGWLEAIVDNFENLPLTDA